MTSRLCQKKHLCALALLLMTSLVGAEFLALAHQVLAHHTYCFEHGHVIDAAAQLEADHHHGHASPVLDDGASIWSSLDSTAHADDGHAHCDKFVFLKMGALSAAAPSALGLTQLDDALPTLADAPFVSISPLFLAPKNSPPVLIG
ncbi:MAG: hypothetical protein LBM75_01740 [Myxococcales bacterium]|jgi:hypothetical protein|nr:hypothetical protein [Myxococcales bacterium]